MRIGASGILVSQDGKMLLIQRNDTRTFAYPGGTVDAGELPTEAAIREVREETGLIVLPVRLVALNFRKFPPHTYLNFTFRCLLRGGEVTPSEESPHVGFYPTNKLPKPMASFTRQRIKIALAHTGGPVIMTAQKTEWDARIGNFLLRRIIYPYYNWRRARRNEPAYVEPVSWQVSVFVIIQNKAGGVLLCQDNGWHLPGGVADDDRPPWETAVSFTQSQTQLDIKISNLRSVYITEGRAEMVLIFTAHTDSTTGTWFTADELPENTAVSHPQFIQTALLPGDETNFRYLKI